MGSLIDQLSSNSTSYDFYRGHISSNDQLGDSLLISIGAKISLPIACHFTGEVVLEILLHEIDGEKEKIVEDSNQCPQNIETSPSSTGIEFRVKSEQVIEEISNSFTNNAAVYQAVLSQAVNKVGNDLREVRAEIVKMDAVSQDNYELILSEIDKYKIVSE